MLLVSMPIRIKLLLLELFLYIVLCLLLLDAGDIERNPGPGNENVLSIMHINIRSITDINSIL